MCDLGKLSLAPKGREPLIVIHHLILWNQKVNWENSSTLFLKLYTIMFLI
jgi:hypothetical protein